MRTKTPSSLKWLVDKRARLVHRIAQLREQSHGATLRAATLESARVRTMEDLAALDRVLSMHEIQVHPESIRPLCTQVTGRLLPHSHLTRSIMTCLRQANGGWRSTTEVMVFVATGAGLEVDDTVYASLRLSVRKRLKNLRVAGRVIRRHAAKTGIEGYWALPQESSGNPGI